MSRLEGEPTCGVESHLTKAKLEGNSFFVQTKVKGGSGALTSKMIHLNDILQEDIAYFQDHRHTPAEWESPFDRAKLAKHSNGIPLSQYLYDDQDSAPDKETSVLDYGPTPKKQRSSLDSPSSLGWVELPTMKDELRSVRPSSQDSPDTKKRNNDSI